MCSRSSRATIPPKQASGAKRALVYLLFCSDLLANSTAGQQLASGSHSGEPAGAQANGQPQPQARTSSQKIGLAPYDRPACQLPPIVAQRRLQNQAQNLFSSGISEPINEPAQLPANQSKVDPLSSATISAPSVVSLQAGKGANSAARKFDSSERLRQLRQLLTSNNYDAYLVTPNDEHGSELVTEYDRRLRFISGFTGSNGFALILLDRAVLFTDGRYAIQADQDLDCNWWLVVSDEPLVDIANWLRANTAKGIKVATDARLMSLQSFDYLDNQLRRLDSEFALISQDLVDVVWNNAGDLRVSLQEPIFVHPIQFSGNITWQEKLMRVVDSMAKLNVRHYIVSKLDDIAWLLNLRGNDIPMAPLFKAYLFISRAADQQTVVRQHSVGSVEQLLASSNQAQALQAPQVLQVQPNQSVRVVMYVDLKKIDQSVRDHLHVDNGTLVVSQQQSDSQATVTTRIHVELKDYEVFIMEIRDKLNPSAGARQLQGKLMLEAGANVAIHVLAKAYEDRLLVVEGLINKLKAVKSDSEVNGMRLAHWRDSLAISMLLAQLELDIGSKGLADKWTETSASNELEFYRSLMDYNRGQSFETISAYGSNAAIVHYKPGGIERAIGNQSTYLLDSGGQYLDGTTDITRTTHYGDPSDFQRETYTRVLMGAIDTMSLILPQSPRDSYRINDLLSRRHLFELGLDYMHGTGHGIGLYSLVHEAPALIESFRSASSQRQVNASKQPVAGQPNQPTLISEPVALQANMFTSVEPGYYKAGDFGIRLENIVVTRRQSLPSRPIDWQESKASQNADRHLLRLEPISLVPFEPKLIKLELLSNKQKAWLNSYNLMVRLRMTQQINYYLAKIRNAQSQSIQVQGTASSSRIYQHLLAQRGLPGAGNNKSELQQIQLGYYNFLRLEGGKLQEKLEQTHRWIMSKTELIPLDVPRSLVAPVQPGSGGLSTKQVTSDLPGAKDENQQVPAEGNNFDNQKLLLAYMSSMPFNDQEASEAVASFARDSLVARSDNGSARLGSSPGSRCSGLECDFWLVNAMNGHQNRQQHHRASQQPWAEGPLVDGAVDSDGAAGFSSLLDLFQLNSSSQTISPNMWSIVLLGFLMVLQLSFMTYMCRNRSGTCNICRTPNRPSAS